MCLNDIQPNEAVIHCNEFQNPFHRGCLITRRTESRNSGELKDCPICLDDIQFNQAIIKCNTCRKSFHHGELITWLTGRRRNRGELQDCPSCRGDMGK